jgi:hypothetical protein
MAQVAKRKAETGGARPTRWRGVAIREAFDTNHIPPDAHVVRSWVAHLEGDAANVVCFCAIDVTSTAVERVTQWASRRIRVGWYMHLVLGDRMRVIFRGRVMECNAGDPASIERVRQHGIATGIHVEQLELEKLFDDPFS